MNFSVAFCVSLKIFKIQKKRLKRREDIFFQWGYLGLGGAFRVSICIRRKAIPAEFLFYGIPQNFTEFPNIIPALFKNSAGIPMNGIPLDTLGEFIKFSYIHGQSASRFCEEAHPNVKRMGSFKHQNYIQRRERERDIYR